MGPPLSRAWTHAVVRPGGGHWRERKRERAGVSGKTERGGIERESLRNMPSKKNRFSGTLRGVSETQRVRTCARTGRLLACVCGCHARERPQEKGRDVTGDKDAATKGGSTVFSQCPLARQLFCSQKIRAKATWHCIKSYFPSDADDEARKRQRYGVVRASHLMGLRGAPRAIRAVIRPADRERDQREVWRWRESHTAGAAQRMCVDGSLKILW